MINYFKAAEDTLRARALLDTALDNLERRKEKLLKHGFPSADALKAYTSAKDVNVTLSGCLALSEIVREINSTRDAIEHIDTVLNQLDESDRKLLRLWYIERVSKDEIAMRMNYASSKSVYDNRNRAVSRFALLYFGAGALAAL